MQNSFLAVVQFVHKKNAGNLPGWHPENQRVQTPLSSSAYLVQRFKVDLDKVSLVLKLLQPLPRMPVWLYFISMPARKLEDSHVLLIIRFKPLCRVRGSGRCRSGSVAPVASSYIKLHGQEFHLAAGGDVKLGDALMHVFVLIGCVFLLLDIAEGQSKMINLTQRTRQSSKPTRFPHILRCPAQHYGNLVAPGILHIDIGV